MPKTCFYCGRNPSDNLHTEMVCKIQQRLNDTVYNQQQESASGTGWYLLRLDEEVKFLKDILSLAESLAR